jgi:hypothetical protein
MTTRNKEDGVGGGQTLYRWYVATCKENVAPVPNEPHILCGFTPSSDKVNYYFETEERAADACGVFDSASVSIEMQGTHHRCARFRAEKLADGHYVLFCEFPFPCPTSASLA